METVPKTPAPRKSWLIRAARILICVGLVSPLTVNIFLGVVTNYVDEDTSLEWNKPNHAAPHFEKPDAGIDAGIGRRRGLGGQMNSRKLRPGDGDQGLHESGMNVDVPGLFASLSALAIERHQKHSTV